MKILFINNLYSPYTLGGAEISVQFLAEAMAEAGHQVIVICIIPDQNFYIDYVNNVKVFYLSITGLKRASAATSCVPGKYPLFWRLLDIYNPFTIFQVSKILNEEKPDIVNTNNLAGFSISVWQSIKQQKIKLVHTLRDHYLLCAKSTMYKNEHNCNTKCISCNFFTFPRYYLSNQVDAVIGNSIYILDRHLDFGYFSSVPVKKVIHNIYETHPIETKTNNQEKKNIRFGYIGRLQKKKGFHFLIRALLDLKQKDWELRVAGDKREIEHQISEFQCIKNINLLGFVPPASFYNEIDVLIVPHLAHEPLPRVIFEAFAHGIPVIGSDRGGIPEIITSSKNGFIYSAENIKELQKYLITFIDHPMKILSMRDYCLNSALNFSKRKISQQYIDIYSTLID